MYQLLSEKLSDPALKAQAEELEHLVSRLECNHSSYKQELGELTEKLQTVFEELKACRKLIAMQIDSHWLDDQELGIYRRCCKIEQASGNEPRQIKIE